MDAETKANITHMKESIDRIEAEFKTVRKNENDIIALKKDSSLFNRIFSGLFLIVAGALGKIIHSVTEKIQ